MLADGIAVAVCHFTVGEYQAKVQSFQLDVDDVEVEWGKTEHVVVKRVYPVGIYIGDVSFNFTSSDATVMTVETDADGWGCKIKGLKPGYATLHASVDDVESDISVTVTKQRLGLDKWRFLSPLNKYDLDRPSTIESALPVYYPAPVELYIYDETTWDHRIDVSERNGVYRSVNHNKGTLAAGVDSDYCNRIFVLAKGDGSSDDEGWGKMSLYYEDNLYVSAVENLEVEFHGCVGIHGDMTLKRVGNTTDLHASTTSVTKGTTVNYCIARKSNKDIKGIYRFNTKKEWIRVSGTNVVVEDPQYGQGGIFTFSGWWPKSGSYSSGQIAIATSPIDYGWRSKFSFYDENMCNEEGFGDVVDDDLADTGMFIVHFKVN